MRKDDIGDVTENDAELRMTRLKGFSQIKLVKKNSKKQIHILRPQNYHVPWYANPDRTLTEWKQRAQQLDDKYAVTMSYVFSGLRKINNRISVFCLLPTYKKTIIPDVLG